MSYSIAIDGPAGAGKSTIAKEIAKRLSFVYIDTGAMYRAMAVYFMENKADTEDYAELEKMCEKVDVVITYEEGVQQVLLNGENVTGRLRTEEVGKMASKTSQCPAVRKKLVLLQQKLAQSTDVIMDGRDIGTYVLPAATLKIYLTASVAARAKRRFDELVQKGENPDLQVITEDIEKRDYADMHREHSPLRQAEDAVYLDTSDMGIAQVAEKIIRMFEERK